MFGLVLLPVTLILNAFMCGALLYRRLRWLTHISEMLGEDKGEVADSNDKKEEDKDSDADGETGEAAEKTQSIDEASEDSEIPMGPLTGALYTDGKRENAWKDAEVQFVQYSIT